MHLIATIPNLEENEIGLAARIRTGRAIFGSHFRAGFVRLELFQNCANSGITEIALVVIPGLHL